MTDKTGAKRGTRHQPPPDTLNETIGVLARREVEARILAPIIEEMGAAFGHEAVMSVLRATIVRVAEEQGAALCRRMGGNSLAHFAEALESWTRGGALEIEVMEQTEKVFAFHVTRCRYAELYRELGIPEALGTALSCARDFALLAGFNPAIILERNHTLMEGGPFCDFHCRHRSERHARGPGESVSDAARIR